MTKLIALRIVVAADDTVETKDAKQALGALVIGYGTKAIGENGTGGRIHWGTADVLQGPEKVPGRKNRKQAAATNGQPELPTS